VLKEFAVDPNVIASSWETCRYLVSQFGADKGRLISKYPNSWKKKAFRKADELPDGRKKEQVFEYINSLGSDWLTLISSNRDYISPSEPWLTNARMVHEISPFSAILCNQEDPKNQLIDANTCDENNPLFATNRTLAVNRNANELAQVASLIVKNCRRLRLIDPYFDPRRPKWRNPLAAMLALIPDISRVECEFHLLDRDNSPPTKDLILHLSQLKGVIPEPGALRIIRWREHEGGERFHRRYLLTENAGLSYEGGLDEEAGANQTTDVSLLDQSHHSARWEEYNLESQTYDLIKPVLVVDFDGNVTQEL